MRKRFFLSIIVLLLLTLNISAASKPKNVIFMIGDGMGLAQVYAAMVTNGNTLELERAKYIGFSKTYSKDRFVTDSAAGGSALSMGSKTNTGMLGMSPDSVYIETILEQASRNGLSTGIVVACALTHATPASYIAHQPSRSMNEEIAADYLKTDIDVFIGGGRKYFENRKNDNRNLTEELKVKGYQILYTLEEIQDVKKGKIAGLVYENHPPKVPDRGDFLPDATMAAIDILKNNKKGFFMMIEGSQIDWACHANDIEFTIDEMLDFDKTIGKVLDFAERDGETLVIITADHETGGLSLVNGNMSENTVEAAWTTKSHTGIPVPIFAFGPGSQEFIGFLENTVFKDKIATLLRLK